MKRYAIIVAGGQGERMKNHIPKQFLIAHDRPVLMHTLADFRSCSEDIEIILVLPPAHIKTWERICSEYAFSIPHTVAEGGPSRFHSVKSGLSYIKETEALVAVHDAVRPLAGAELIERVYKDAAYYGTAVPVIPIKESMRERNGALSQSVPRSHYVLVQTPQCFLFSNLQDAYRQPYHESFTDDATVVEKNGGVIHLTEGNPVNIKITTPEDLIMISSLISIK